MYIILLLADWNFELIEIWSMIHGWLYLVYIFSLIISMLLGNENEINEFPLQQWLRERAAMLHCLSCLFFAQSMYIIKPYWGSHVSSRLLVNFISKTSWRISMKFGVARVWPADLILVRTDQQRCLMWIPNRTSSSDQIKSYKFC
jgi:hypothetical protein